MTDPLDPSATHGLDLHDAHHVSMDKFDLGHLNGLDDVDDHFPDFDNDEAFAVPDVKPDMSPHHSNMDMNMNGGGNDAADDAAARVRVHAAARAHKGGGV